MANETPYHVLAYYQFHPIVDARAEVAAHKEFLSGCDATGRIYISEEGINGQLCCAAQDTPKYAEWMHSRAPFQNLEFKIHHWHEHAFPRLVIKYRKYLVGRETTPDLTKQGVHLSPKEWKEKLDQENRPLLLDVRNDYEWKVGHFEGAERPACETYREFESYADTLKEKCDPKTQPVMMCCTGGIRCEIFSALLREKGFAEVYQLQGGIIKYGLEVGSSHWLGKLFVFDDRLTVPISEEKAPVIGKCRHCDTSIEDYYNCANTDCNDLFLCCKECLVKFGGCCQKSCQEAPRVRPYHHQDPHKPFRRAHHYFIPK